MAIILNQNLTANGSTPLASIVNPNNGATPYLVVQVSGDFDGGTATVVTSNDGGATTFDVTSSLGAVIFTDDDSAEVRLLGGDNLIKIGVVLLGASSPDINVTIADAR